MADEKKWERFYGNTGDPKTDFILIEYGREEVATIRKDNKITGELVVVVREAETTPDIPLDWLIEVLREAKGKLS
jgi:hypothetical protein